VEGLVYSPTTPEGLCRFETPQTLSNELASETMDVMELLERTAAEASRAFCQSELKRLAPLEELDFSLTDKNLVGTKQELDERDVTLLQCYGLLDREQQKYRETPGTQLLIDYLAVYKHKIASVLASRPVKFLN
jgi:hypothetical protein